MPRIELSSLTLAYMIWHRALPFPLLALIEWHYSLPQSHPKVQHIYMFDWDVLFFSPGKFLLISSWCGNPSLATTLHRQLRKAELVGTSCI